MSKDVQEEAQASVLILHYGNQLSINYKCSWRLSEVCIATKAWWTCRASWCKQLWAPRAERSAEPYSLPLCSWASVGMAGVYMCSQGDLEEQLWDLHQALGQHLIVGNKSAISSPQPIAWVLNSPIPSITRLSHQWNFCLRKTRVAKSSFETSSPVAPFAGGKWQEKAPE